ncbi:hypothetical protein [Pseudobutyrivibrio sp. ACV-2]|uniref:hypothetical protein n=1 Tax=Pseudobutyrivibrio sp. ACV-2 TaxID=1520801 RepID=UPI000B7EAE54|nr:hypothetical protein [Pseudobutyrivibrio sp. ACV-2]
MEGIKDYEQGNAGKGLTEEQFIESRIRLRSKNVRPTGSIRIYGIRNGGRFRELVIRKSGQILWRDGSNTRIIKNRKTGFDSFTRYNNTPGEGTKLADLACHSFEGIKSTTADLANTGGTNMTIVQH